jgi:hypothetical protein
MGTVEHGTLAMCKIVSFLDFAHRLYFNKITTFRKLDLLQVKEKEQQS